MEKQEENRTERENLEAYFERLEKLSTEELDREAQRCVLSEQRSVACVIAHLAEISRREAHLRLGFTSLFDYGVRRLGLSEGSVYLRMQVANVARRFPAILSHRTGSASRSLELWPLTSLSRTPSASFPIAQRRL